MGLTISSQRAQIGIERTPSQLKMHTQNARLELRQKQARVNIRTERMRIEIDQYECFASAGLKNPLDLSREAAAQAYQNVMRYIQKTAADGDMLAAIENGGEPLAVIAERDAWPEKEFVLDFIPKGRPKITVHGGVKLDPERNAEGVNNGVHGDYTPGNVSISYTPSRIRIYMRQYGRVSIKHTPSGVDVRV